MSDGKIKIKSQLNLKLLNHISCIFFFYKLYKEQHLVILYYFYIKLFFIFLFLFYIFSKFTAGTFTYINFTEFLFFQTYIRLTILCFSFYLYKILFISKCCHLLIFSKSMLHLSD